MRREGSDGETVNAARLARLHGVHVNTITYWINAGCPVKTAGSARARRHEFDTAAVVRWLVGRAIEEATAGKASTPDDELRRRRLAADTSLAEMAAAKKRGELVEVEAVERATAVEYLAIRARLLTVDARVSPLIVGETDERKIRNAIRSEVEDALTELAGDPGTGTGNRAKASRPKLSKAAA